MSAVAVATPRTSRPVEVNLKPLRLLGAVMLAGAVVKPYLPSAVGPPPCPLRSITGIPCPFCGMTRGVTALIHGHASAAFAFNPGVFAVVALAVVLLVAWRWQRVKIPVWAVFLVFTLLWSYQMFKYATGRPL